MENTTTTTTTAIGRFNFLSLPIEIRYLIYEAIIDLSHSDDLQDYDNICLRQNLLLLNRQISDEAIPFVVQRGGRSFFRFLGEFVDWTSRGDPRWLRCVRDLEFMWNGDSLHSFRDWLMLKEDEEGKEKKLSVEQSAGQMSSPSPSSSVTASWWEDRYMQLAALESQQTNRQAAAVSPSPCLAPWARFVAEVRGTGSGCPQGQRSKTSPIAIAWRALSAVPELQTVSFDIQSEWSMESFPSYRAEQQILVEIISTACPEIRNLSIFGTLLPLEILKQFKKLRRLEFMGYSTSTPQETLNIFLGLKDLRELILRRSWELGGPRYCLVPADLSHYVAVTPEVLAGMNPLQKLSINHTAMDVESPFITVEMIRALHSHADSLEELSIVSNAVVDNEVVKEILDFVSQVSRLRILTLVMRVEGKGYDNGDVSPFILQKLRQCTVCIEGSSTSQNNLDFLID